MSSPRKVTTMSQVMIYHCQVSSKNMSSIMCQISDIRCQVISRSCDKIQENNIIKHFKLFTTILK